MGHSVELITEPEAAALHTLRHLTSSPVMAGDTVIVCDAGGGTVDTISYRINTITPLRLEEVSTGKSGLCESEFLNLGFEEALKAKLGQQRFDSMRVSHPTALPSALKLFEEEIKLDFDVDEQDHEHTIDLSGMGNDEEIGLRDGRLVMTSNEMHDVFRPVIDEAIHLVNQQLEAVVKTGRSVKAILLVGGFGQSLYLHKSIQRRRDNTELFPAAIETHSGGESG